MKEKECLGVFTILHYGRSIITVRCIDSLLKIKGIEKCKVIVLDNCSCNGSYEELVDKYKNNDIVKIYVSTVNGGFSQGNNYLYSKAKQYKPEFIAMLNNDIEIKQKSFILELLECIKTNEYYVIGPDVYKPSTHEHQAPLYDCLPSSSFLRQNFMSVYYRISNLGYIPHKTKRKIFREFILRHIPGWIVSCYRAIRFKSVFTKRLWEKQENVVLQGSCIIFTNKYIENEDVAFEPDTKFYFEELLLALKCRTKCYKTLYNPSLKTIHKHAEATLSSSKDYSEYMKTQAERMIHGFEVYKMCEDTNPWEGSI